MPCSAEPLLSLKEVTKAFGSRLLFSGLDLHIEAGRIYLLCGPNGAGKSTLLKIMAGLLKPDKGTVDLFQDQAKLGYMAHATFIYPGLTARENLIFWGKALNLQDPETKAGQALEAVSLQRQADEPAGKFSRGMSQRLNLARLIQADADLWLLDEPGTGLDQKSLTQLRNFISQAAEQGKAVVWISHSVDADAALADHKLELDKRRLIIQPGGRKQ